ncbi:armadillo-like helical domain-containing protein 2 [Leucoraja erinacea]|uniref:armadillo-like helical domain-containing protein 2 n=1 Tax=Leucoraja erinaceus TaxID=7782 RepID=UPI00245466B9|nr:armadillo-like helical domain-containing protein 2 [Leucoraja erinacea]
MFKCLDLFRRSKTSHEFFHNPEEDIDYKMRDNVYTKQIKDYGEALQNTHLPLYNRLQAAVSLGIISYTGGPEAANCVQAYIEPLLRYLNQTIYTEEDQITVLQSLAGICYNNTANQSTVVDQQILTTLVSMINSRNSNVMSIKVKFWACYLLHVLCCNNIPIIRRLNKAKYLHPSLIHLSELSWIGWPDNYAQVLIYILGFEKQSQAL